MNERDRDLVDELLRIDHGLTCWELDFAESLDEQLASGRVLTNRQRDKAEQIICRVEEGW